MTDTQKIVERLRKGSVGTWDGEKLVDLRPTSEEIREAADTIERLTAQLNEARAEDSIHSNTERSACADCSLPYSDPGFSDLVIPDTVFGTLIKAVPGDGLLCPTCLCRRAAKAGLQDVRATFTSGPFAIDIERAGVSVNQPTEDTE